MTTIRTKPMSHKKSGLPLGITKVIRNYKKGNRRSHYEFQVYYQQDGKVKIKHFYISNECTIEQEQEILNKAVKFRKEYEDKIYIEEKMKQIRDICDGYPSGTKITEMNHKDQTTIMGLSALIDARRFRG